MDIIVIGFALFAMFFGAGNLIFPPMLGYIYGDKWLLASIVFFSKSFLYPFFIILSTIIGVNAKAASVSIVL